MKKIIRNIIKWSIGLFFGLFLLYIIINLLMPAKIISYYGWIDIADKTVVEDTYYITTDLGEGMIEIEMNESESFLYKETPQKSEDIVMADVWESIEKNERYHALVEYNGLFFPKYEIEKLYGY